MVVGPLSHIFSGQFEDPVGLQSPASHLTLCGILVNITDLTAPSRQLESLLEFSSGRPLHLIVLTDETSLRGTANMIGAVLSRELSYRLIKQTWNKDRPIPPLKVRCEYFNENKVEPASSFVDIKSLLPKMSGFMDLLKLQSSSSGLEMKIS